MERPDPQQDPEAWRLYWIEQMAIAQTSTGYDINGAIYRRVPYGQESSDARFTEHLCHDCGITVGQLHVPGCDVEICPKCGSQAISCDCGYYPGDSEQFKKAAQELHRDPTSENARRLGFVV